ncbi:hypothetical protein SAMN05880566_12821 [Janthinobacterium sp. TND4EL3]|uniref:hypothetical protein n=1 Tax=Janthinobacterium sp. TND4EL3 TaxID=1907311 RepID=UPI000956E22F|nr:hypothetical protein [Janthinobacterium sp. TND4EL3]SIR85542.1 hypothetical protein SAMN05880566_12821 [Janthinobacterium sp. TND4EL3]
MAITTPLMDEILQHFARVFPMPGRIDGREDYLALVKTWSDQLEPYSDEQVKEACRRLMGKLKRFPYPSDVLDELAPASATSTMVVSLSVEVDSSSIDAAMAKVEQLKTDLLTARDQLQQLLMSAELCGILGERAVQRIDRQTTALCREVSELRREG